MRNDTNKPQQQQSGRKVMAGKLKEEVYDILFEVAKVRGLSVNELINIIAEVLLRYLSPDHQLTSDIERAMSLFEHMAGWKDQVLMSSDKEFEVARAIYALTAKGKKGVVPVMVDRPFMGEWTQTENITAIYEACIEMISPEFYRRMRRCAVADGCNNLYEWLGKMMDERTSEADFNEMRQQFADNDRSEFGVKPDMNRYVRKLNRRKDIDNVFEWADNNDDDDA